MRMFRVIAAGLVFLAAASAGFANTGDMGNAPMKSLFDEMKAFAESERGFREAKKSEIQGVEAQIDKLRADAKAKGETKDPDSVKPLQAKRLSLLEEVAQRDVQSSEKGLTFAQRRLEISKQNLQAFEQKKAEADKSIAA